VHPAETYGAALELGEIGMDASWIAEQLGVPRGTIKGRSVDRTGTIWSAMLTKALACLLVVTAVGCGGGGDEDRSSGTAASASATSTPTDSRPDPVVPEDALLGIVSPWSGAGTIVAPVDRRSLEPGVPWAELGEYHDAWAVSPDGRLIAFGISAPSETGGIGIRVIDRATLQTVRDIDTGIAAEALGWLQPNRLAAFLQSGEVVVVDPGSSSQELGREALGAISCPFAPPNAVTALGFVMVIPVAGSARLVQVDARSRVQTVKLDDIGLGERFGLCESVGLAVDPARLKAYVVAAEARVAEVDLRTTRVRRHRVAGAPSLVSDHVCPACGAQREAVWLGDGRLAVAGYNHREGARSTPVGAVLVDTRDWTARRIARRAGAAQVAGKQLLVFDGRHPAVGPRRGAGLRVYDRSGRLRFTLLGASASATSRSRAGAPMRAPRAGCG